MLLRPFVSSIALMGLITLCAHASGDPASQADKPEITDRFRRLLYTAGKQAIPCAAQDDATAVLLLIGQSNGANSGEHYYRSHNGGAVVNFVDGACYIASSPLLGAEGTQGEAWTALGDNLVDSGIFNKVILVPAAIGGSSIDRWQSGGDLNSMLIIVLAHTRRLYSITHVLWHQGERDHRLGTSRDSYVKSFRSLSHSLRAHGVKAPIFVSVATKCASANWIKNNPVAEAQRALPNHQENIFAGVDTDTLLTDGDRRDGCHFSATGQQKFADAWTALLSRAGTPYQHQSSR